MALQRSRTSVALLRRMRAIHQYQSIPGRPSSPQPRAREMSLSSCCCEVWTPRTRHLGGIPRLVAAVSGDGDLRIALAYLFDAFVQLLLTIQLQTATVSSASIEILQRNQAVESVDTQSTRIPYLIPVSHTRFDTGFPVLRHLSTRPLFNR